MTSRFSMMSYRSYLAILSTATKNHPLTRPLITTSSFNRLYNRYDSNTSLTIHQHLLPPSSSPSSALMMLYKQHSRSMCVAATKNDTAAVDVSTGKKKREVRDDIEDKAKSKVEKAAEIRSDSTKSRKELTPKAASASAATATPSVPHGDVSTESVSVSTNPPAKKSMWQRIVAEVKHYYNGFRLLGTDVRICTKLVGKMIRSKTLTRRERRQLVRTTSDLFRLVPFSVFIIVPFMEALLPFFVAMFPGLLPSTFTNESAQVAKEKQRLKAKIEMAKFLHETVEDMAVVSKDKKENDAAEEFVTFYNRIRSEGGHASPDEIIKYSKLFEDEFTLDHLTHRQIVAMCKLMLLNHFGTTQLLRFQLRMTMRQLRSDDLMIKNEGIDVLTPKELQSALQARGMRCMGISVDRMRDMLQEWLDLHVVHDVPSSLLILSRAMNLTDKSPEELLEDTLRAMPQNVVQSASVQIKESDGGVDNEAKLLAIRQEQLAIENEQKEDAEADKLREVISDATMNVATTTNAGVEVDLNAVQQKEINRSTEEEKSRLMNELLLAKETSIERDATEAEPERITHEDLGEIGSAVQDLRSRSAVQEEREELLELKEDREDYVEDVAELESATNDMVSESVTSKALGRRVEKMILNLESEIENIDSQTADKAAVIDIDGDGVITTDELVYAMGTLGKKYSPEKLRKMAEMLDFDKDGTIQIEELVRVMKAFSEEDVDMETQEIARLVSEFVRKETDAQSSLTKDN